MSRVAAWAFLCNPNSTSHNCEGESVLEGFALSCVREAVKDLRSFFVVQIQLLPRIRVRAALVRRCPLVSSAHPLDCLKDYPMVCRSRASRSWSAFTLVELL